MQGGYRPSLDFGRYIILVKKVLENYSKFSELHTALYTHALSEVVPPGNIDVGKREYFVSVFSL